MVVVRARAMRCCLLVDALHVTLRPPRCTTRPRGQRSGRPPMARSTSSSRVSSKQRTVVGRATMTSQLYWYTESAQGGPANSVQNVPWVCHRVVQSCG